jgi:hypothetical protein
VARCRSCGQAFCRECVVEHEQRLLCAECLRREAGRTAARGADGWRRRLPWAAAAQWAAALAVVWVTFYGATAVLRRVPSAIHDGLIWQPRSTDRS